MAAGKTRIILRCARDLTSELFESLALGLWDEQGSEDTAQHEESEDLQDVVEPRGLVGLGRTTNAERSNKALRDDGADLSRGGRETVTGGAVTSREALSRHDERSRVWSEVEEEVSNDEAAEDAPFADLVVTKAH